MQDADVIVASAHICPLKFLRRDKELRPQSLQAVQHVIMTHSLDFDFDSDLPLYNI